MTELEMIKYLEETGLYHGEGLYYETRMMRTDKSVPIKELTERFIELDKEYGGEPWNIKQILANIDIIIPVEDRYECLEES